MTIDFDLEKLNMAYPDKIHLSRNIHNLKGALGNYEMVFLNESDTPSEMVFPREIVDYSANLRTILNNLQLSVRDSSEVKVEELQKTFSSVNTYLNMVSAHISSQSPNTDSSKLWLDLGKQVHEDVQKKIQETYFENKPSQDYVSVDNIESYLQTGVRKAILGDKIFITNKELDLAIAPEDMYLALDNLVDNIRTYSTGGANVFDKVEHDMYHLSFFNGKKPKEEIDRSLSSGKGISDTASLIERVGGRLYSHNNQELNKFSINMLIPVYKGTDDTKE